MSPCCRCTTQVLRANHCGHIAVCPAVPRQGQPRDSWSPEPQRRPGSVCTRRRRCAGAATGCDLHGEHCCVGGLSPRVHRPCGCECGRPEASLTSEKQTRFESASITVHAILSFWTLYHKMLFLCVFCLFILNFKPAGCSKMVNEVLLLCFRALGMLLLHFYRGIQGLVLTVYKRPQVISVTHSVHAFFQC